MTEDPLEAWAKEVTSRHCWHLGETNPCILTSQQGFNLMTLGYEYAEKLGFPNNGTAGMGFHPTQEDPLVSVEVWVKEDRAHASVFFTVDLEKHTAKLYANHGYCNSYRSGCRQCMETIEAFRTGKPGKIDRE